MKHGLSIFVATTSVPQVGCLINRPTYSWDEALQAGNLSISVPTSKTLSHKRQARGASVECAEN